MIIGKSAARSSRRNVGDRLKTMCRQKLRNEVPERGNPLYLALHPRPPPSASVIVRVLHIILIFCSRSISASLLRWRISDGASSFLGNGRQPFLVEPCCGLVSKRAETRST